MSYKYIQVSPIQWTPFFLMWFEYSTVFYNNTHTHTQVHWLEHPSHGSSNAGSFFQNLTQSHLKETFLDQPI